MRISVKHHPSPRLVIAALVTPLLLAACVPAQQGGTPRACERDCRIEITLPEDPKNPENPAELVKPPTVESDKLHFKVKAGSDVNFKVDKRGDAARTVLVFSEPAFMDPKSKKAVYVLHAKPELGNSYTALPDVCPPEVGCKYTIVNYGRPEREPLDPWIIIE